MVICYYCRILLQEKKVITLLLINQASWQRQGIIPLLLMIGLIVGRGYSIVSMSDAIARSIFVPLFAWFTMNIHRETVSSSPRASQFSISSVLSWKPLTYLGAISFPIYILHGPIGQIFYKRVVANKIFGFGEFVKSGSDCR